MGYLNPLLNLPAGKALMSLPAEDRIRISAVLRELRAQANTEAENSWKRRKGPMAAYWRAVSTYARHLAHALGYGGQPAGEDPIRNAGRSIPSIVLRALDRMSTPLDGTRLTGATAQRDAEDMAIIRGYVMNPVGFRARHLDVPEEPVATNFEF